MATFNGTSGADVADGPGGILTGFTGGTLAELQDATGDTFNPGNGADLIVAGSGVDTINGSSGADTMRGGAGNDLYVYFNATDIVGDVIDGGANAGGNGDQIQIGFTGTADFSAVSIASVGATSIEFLNLFGNVAHSLVFNGSQVSTTGLSSTLGVQGNTGADIITFNNVSGTFDISGFTFNIWNQSEDRIVVNATGQTSFTGASVAEEYNGSNQQDFMTGSLGADTLRGGADDDTFIYTAANQSNGDIIDGGAQGVLGDGISVRFAGTTDFTMATIASTGTTSIERFFFDSPGDKTVIFNASQFGPTGIATNLQFQDNSGGANTFTVNNISGAFDASTFIIGGWNGTSRFIFSASGSASQITGTAYRDEINGSSLADSLLGGDGADTLNGMGGDDTLRGGLDADQLSGDAGNDVFRYLSATEITGDVIDGGTESGLGDALRVEFTGTADFSTATFSSVATSSIERLELSGGGAHSVIFDAGQLIGTGRLSSTLFVQGDNAGVDTVTFNNIANSYFFNLSTFVLQDWQAQDKFIFNTSSSGSDLTGTSGADIVNGGTGRDTVYGTLGSDELHGGAGSDSFSYSSNAQIAGDTIDGGTENGFNGDSLQVTFTGLADFRTATILSTGQSSIELLWFRTGGDHDVRFNGSQFGGGGLASNLLVQGNTGIDSLAFDNVIGSLDLSALGFTVWTDGVDRVFATGGAGAQSIIGSSRNDSIDGGGGNDTLIGGTGDDTLVGGTGNDVYVVDSTGDVITEAAGDAADEVRTTLASFILGTTAGSSNVENLSFIGNGGFSGTGSSAANLITGGTGSDTLTGGAGDDTLTGSAGDDTFTYASGAGFDTITDFVAGGTDDRLNISAVASLSDFAKAQGLATQAGADTIITLGFNNVITLKNVTATALTTADFVLAAAAPNNPVNGTAGPDTLTGTAGVDSMTGGTGNDSMAGLAGDDTISSGDGEDYLLGGADNDLLDGGIGNDVLLGDTGNDTLIGGDGVDYLYSGTGNNVLSGGTGLDILISEGTSDIMNGGADQNYYYRSANGTSQIFGGDGVDILVGGTFASNDLFNGFGGDDYALGGAGNDELIGGTGNDILIGEDGNDTLDGGTGTNYLYADGTGSDLIKVNASAGGTQTQLLLFFEAGGVNDSVNITGSTLTSFAGYQALAASLGTVIGGNLLQNTAAGCVLTLGLATANQTDIWFFGTLAGGLTSADFSFI